MFARFTYNVRTKTVLLIGIPLVLASFTHLWNPIGFPSIYVDEAHYMRRVMNVLEGFGPQESANIFHHPYDHPYFGQIFLAGILNVVGYPTSLHVFGHGNMQSFEMLYMIPRVLMGILAVVDTFVIYKIAERRYNRKVAFIASLLFAIIPVGWLIRRIWLESIQLPFLLLSILFVVRSTPDLTTSDGNVGRTKENVLVVLTSGIFLGLAIFTKIPAITMIPLVGYLVYTTYNKNMKLLGVWFIPVVSISLVWPSYATYLDQFDMWYQDVFWHMSRTGEVGTTSQVLVDLFRMDPVLLVLGAAGIVLSVIRRDLFLFLWTFPYIIFSYIVVHSSYWYFIPLLPAFCIGASRLIEVTTNLIGKKKIQQISLFGITAAIGLFGLISTTILISTNVTSSYFRAGEFIARSLPTNNESNGTRVLVTGGVGFPTYTWLLAQILDMEHDFRMLHILFSGNPAAAPTNTTKALFVVDRSFDNIMTALINMQRTYELGPLVQILKLYNGTSNIAYFTGNADTYNAETYPYFAMKFNNELTASGPDRIEVRANFEPTFLNKTR
jgi:Dolichyl-phosphate-mannose-protein mannosyltransferase